MNTSNQPIPSWEENLAEHAVLHNEDCCVHFPEDSRACDVGTGLVDCCENIRMIAGIFRQTLTTAHTEWREQVLKAFDVEYSEEHSQQHVEPSECGIVVDCIIARLPFLQPPKDTVCVHEYEKHSHICTKCGKKDGFSRSCGLDFCQCAS